MAPPLSHVYAIGRIEARFPRLSIEKEFAQVIGRGDGAAGRTDQQLLHSILKQKENRYLARQMCWVFSVQGFDTYLLHPRDLVDFDQLIEAIRAEPDPADLDVVIGVKGPVAPPEACNGLMVPIVAFDKIYSFKREALLDSIPVPPSLDAPGFKAAAGDVFDRILRLADNAGSTDEHRALNYSLVRYAAVYGKAAEAYARGASLTAIDVRPSGISSGRRVVEVIFSFTDRVSDFTEKVFARVDVTEEFPFLVSKLAPYFDR